MGRGFRGMPGGGNMNQMMKQVQKMQKEMEKMQEDLQDIEVEATVGGGVVTAKANGHKEIVEINIEKDVVDPEDVDMLEDLIISAVNEALRKAEEEMEKGMAKITGGLNIPGL